MGYKNNLGLINYMKNNENRVTITEFICGLLFAMVAHWSYLKFVNTRIFLVLFIIVSVFFLIIRNSSFVIKIVKPHKMLLIIALINFVQLMYSSNMSKGFRFVFQLIMMIVLSVLIYNIDGLSKAIIYILIFSSSICVLFILLQILNPDYCLDLAQMVLKSTAYKETVTLNGYGYMSGLSGFNAIAGFISGCSVGWFGISLFSDFDTQVGSVNGKIINLFCFALSLIALIATQKRGVLLACGIACIIVLISFLVNRSRRRKVFSIFIIGTLILIVLYFVMTNTVSGQLMLERLNQSDKFLSNRDVIYEKLITGIKEKPIMGHGTGSTYDEVSAGGHNIYLQILYDNGLVGLISYIAFFMVSIIDTLRRIYTNKSVRNVIYLSLFMQVMFVCYGMTGNPLYDFCMFMIYVFFVVISYIPNEESIYEDRNSYLS